MIERFPLGRSSCRSDQPSSISHYPMGPCRRREGDTEPISVSWIVLIERFPLGRSSCRSDQPSSISHYPMGPCHRREGDTGPISVSLIVLIEHSPLGRSSCRSNEYPPSIPHQPVGTCCPRGKYRNPSQSVLNGGTGNRYVIADYSPISACSVSPLSPN
jgi:hypothetical protein